MKPFPYAIDVKDLLSMLGGTSVTIKPAKQGFQSLKYPAFAGLFTEDGATEACATVIADFNASMSIAGAFMRIPPSAVLEDLRSQACGEAVRPAMYEIFNIATSLLNATGATHVRLTEMVQLSAKPAGRLADLLTKAPQRLELEACISPCPAGQLLFARS